MIFLDWYNHGHWSIIGVIFHKLLLKRKKYIKEKICSIRLPSIIAFPPKHFQTVLRPCRAADPVFPPSLLLLPWLETQFFTFSVNGQDYSVFIAAWNQEKHLQLFSLLRNEQCISNSLKATTGCALCRAKSKQNGETWVLEFQVRVLKTSEPLSK